MRYRSKPSVPSATHMERLEKRELFSGTSLSILALGDSITYGVGNENQNYRKHLADRLNASGVGHDFVGTRNSGPGDNQHFGVPGARAAVDYTGSRGDFRQSLTNSLRQGQVLRAGERPDVVLLHVGTNTISDSTGSANTAVTELRTLLNELASQYRGGALDADVRVIVSKIIPGGRGANGGVSAAQVRNTNLYNQQIPGVVSSLSDRGFAGRVTVVDAFAARADRAGLSTAERAQADVDGDPYVDWFTGINEAGPGNVSGGNGALMRAGDWLHPTGLGYEVLGGVFFAGLQQSGALSQGTPAPAPTPTPTPTPSPTPSTGATLTTGDFDGDGDQDRLVRDGVGNTRIELLQNGQVSRSGAGWRVASDWTADGSRDLNGDGRSDIRWVDGQGKSGVWTMNGTAFVSGPAVTGSPAPAPTPTPTTPVGPAPSGFTLLASADFDGDGDRDRLLRAEDGSNRTLVQVLSGSGALQSSRDGWNMASSWSVDASRDLNGDGRVDLVWRNPNGQAFTWFMNGTGFASVRGAAAPSTPAPAPTPTTPAAVPAGLRVVGTGDFDGDGDMDRLLRGSGADTRTRIELLQNGGVVQSVSGWNMSRDWTVDTSRDLNGDRRTDVQWRTPGGRTMTWFMNGTSFVR